MQEGDADRDSRQCDGEVSFKVADNEEDNVITSAFD